MFLEECLKIMILLFFLRYKKEYRIFGGLWYGTSKPNMLVFLQPLASTLKRLCKDGELFYHILRLELYM